MSIPKGNIFEKEAEPGAATPAETALICDPVPRSSRTDSQIGKRAQMGYALAGTLWESLFLEADMRKDLRLIAVWLTTPVLLGAGAAAWLLKMTPEQLAGPIFHLAFGAPQLGMCLTCGAGTVVVMKLLRQRREGRA